MPLLLALPSLRVHLIEAERPALELQWLGEVTSAEFRAALHQCLQLSLEHQVKGWLADDRQQGPISQSDLEWTEENILPLLVQNGVVRFAQLESPDIRTRFTVDVVYARTIHVLGFAVHRFVDIAQARAWACYQEYSTEGAV